MNIKFLAIFLLIASLFSCSENREYLVDNRLAKEEGDRDFFVDTLNIEIDSLSLNYYNVFNNYENDGKTLYMGYNKPTHSFDLFSLSDGKLISHIKLSKDGPDKVEEVLDVYIHNLDSIFIFSRSWLQMIDTTGAVKKVININNISPEQYLTYGELASKDGFNLYYNKSRNSLFFYSIYGPAGNLEKPVLNEFFLDDLKIEQLPIRYSDYFVDNDGNVGYLTQIESSFIDDKFILYNFLYESNVYTYNLDTGEKKVFGGKSQYTANLADLIDKKNEDPEAWNRHAIENTYFFDVLHQPKKNHYYRLHWGALSYQASQNQFNSFLDKNLYLTMFNSEFEVVKEVELPKDTYRIYTWFANDNGLYISPTHPRNNHVEENTLSFHIFNLKDA